MGRKAGNSMVLAMALNLFQIDLLSLKSNLRACSTSTGRHLASIRPHSRYGNRRRGETLQPMPSRHGSSTCKSQDHQRSLQTAAFKEVAELRLATGSALALAFTSEQRVNSNASAPCS